ncbi:hypothetical protein [Oryzicola mucosus]|uniref:Uncharacterized protein n=1 Tax=Oryzicola mucosus TaxID=2767425 RepID=A0A8J6PU85_9HYPH|nr:hypothetical protein [Oryzicola mucosus]MBD0414496.1 hypothetical protein [Oryzicola mucosus]
MSNAPYVNVLLRDARMVAEFLTATNGVTNTELRSAIDAVERLPTKDRLLSAPAVTQLAQIYEDLRKQVPFKQFYALRSGWRVFPSKWRRLWTAVMVLAAIAFMICTLHLTRIYNRGVEISAALTTLEQNEAEMRYGELERRLLDAQKQLGDELQYSNFGDAQTTNAGTGTAIIGSRVMRDNERFLLAREASHRLLYELVNLDQRVGTVKLMADSFQRQARYPVAGQQTVEGYLLSLGMKFGALSKSQKACPSGVDAGGQCINGGNGHSKNDFVYTGFFDPRLAGMRQAFCGSVGLLEQYALGKITKAEISKRNPFIGQLVYSFDKTLGVDTAESILRSCALRLNFYSGAFPDIEALNIDVQDTLNLYSLIILPAVYGALGAIIYFLRAFLNPQEPNEGWSRTVYRISLGALAGMIMAWLGMGLLGNDEAFKRIGLGLFAFAFILGFSIDVFFDLLENLVKAARKTVRQVGSADENALPKDPSKGQMAPPHNEPIVGQ